MGLSSIAVANRRLIVRLAQDAQDLAAVQKLRGKVFFEERGHGEPGSPSDRPDGDLFDAHCDHLLVEDLANDPAESVVGTYRLLRENVAARGLGFYSTSEFDIGALLFGPSRPRGELLELGRSCVLAPYRTSATISLLWRGIAEYIAQHRIGLMFGCASFSGTDPDAHAAALSYLYHNHLADETQRPFVRSGIGVPLERLPRGSYDNRSAVMTLPPLVKGYLRAGASFGDGAFIDEAFKSVDVCVVLPVEAINERYAARFRIAA